MSRRPPALMQSALGKVWETALDLIYPPRCGGCDRRGTLFCGACRGQVLPPTGRPSRIREIDGFVAAGNFAGPLREAIHKFKYESDTPLAKALAALLAERLQGQHLFAQWQAAPPTLMPVPLHKKRFRSRGFNQAELLARELSRLIGWHQEQGLMRVVDTRSQVGLDASARRENVLKAFAWQGAHVPEQVLLIDDVCTTGATLSECASVLRAAGTERVYAATVAKAVGKGPEAGG